MRKKITADDWTISFSQPFDEDDEPYYASFNYKFNDEKRESSRYFKTYQAAYGWLAEMVDL